MKSESASAQELEQSRSAAAEARVRHNDQDWCGLRLTLIDRLLRRRPEGWDQLRDRRWLVDESSAPKLVALISPRLTLRSGFRLVTYVRRSGFGGNGWTFALPADAPVPGMPELVSDIVGYSSEPPPPAQALTHFMEAVESDGTLAAYLQASVLMREIKEIGAWWHGIDWATHFLLGNAPGSSLPEAYGRELAGTPEAILNEETWRWRARLPTDWQPRAERTPSGGVDVTLFTYSELRDVAVYRHRDEYPAGGGMAPASSDVQIVGTGGRGFSF